MTQTLAIIIPAYKPDFLKIALASIAQQTCQDFCVYIGDDASPYHLKEIVDKFTSVIPIQYTLFEENLGGKSLTKQWERCVQLAQEEPYVWLFSDDDIMPKDGVERFYKALESYPDYPLFRFNVQHINSSGDEIPGRYTTHPIWETSADFLKRRLAFETLSSAPEYIFLKSAFLSQGGFVEFPMAWCSDDATWSLLGKEKGIVTIAGEPVCMRMSDGKNISSSHHYNVIKFKAVVQFVAWIKAQQFDINHTLMYTYLVSQRHSLPIKRIEMVRYLWPLIQLVGIFYTFTVWMHLSIVYRCAKRMSRTETYVKQKNS